MKHLFNSIFTLLIASLFSFGQEKQVLGVSCSMSDEVEMKGGLIGTDGEHIYTRRKLVVSKWDENLNLKAAEKIPKKTKDYKIKRNKPGEMYFIADKFLHFITQFDPLEKQLELFLVEYDKINFEIIDQRKIATLDYDIKSRSEAYFMEDSNGGSEFSIISMIERGDETEVDLFVINHKLEIDLKRNFSIEKGFNDLRFKNLMISENDVSLVVIEEKHRSPRIEKITFHKYSIKGERHTELSLKIKGSEKYISDFKVTLNSEGNLLLSGFYKLEDGNAIGGAFTQIYDWKEGKLVSQDFSPFATDLVTVTTSESEKKEVATEDELFRPYWYVAKHVIANEDGSSILIGEYFRKKTIIVDKSHSYSSYEHGEIIVMRSSKKGDIEWLKKYPRVHEEKLPGFGDFILKDRNENKFNLLFSTRGVSLEEDGLVIVEVDKKKGSFETEMAYVYLEISAKPFYILTGATLIMNDKVLIRTGRWGRSIFLTFDFDQQ